MYSRLPEPRFLTFSVDQLGYTLFKAVLASSAWLFVVFHDGLTEITFRTFIGAAINYLWIRLVSRFVTSYSDRLILAYVGAITITVGFSRPQLDKYLTEAGYRPRGQKAALALMVLGALVAYFTQSSGPKEPQIANVYYRTLEITRGIGMICIKRSGTKTGRTSAVFVNAIVFFTCIQLAKQITSSTGIQLVLIYLCVLAIRRSANSAAAPVIQEPLDLPRLSHDAEPKKEISVNGQNNLENVVPSILENRIDETSRRKDDYQDLTQHKSTKAFETLISLKKVPSELDPTYGWYDVNLVGPVTRIVFLKGPEIECQLFLNNKYLLSLTFALAEAMVRIRSPPVDEMVCEEIRSVWQSAESLLKIVEATIITNEIFEFYEFMREILRTLMKFSLWRPESRRAKSTLRVCNMAREAENKFKNLRNYYAGIIPTKDAIEKADKLINFLNVELGPQTNGGWVKIVSWHIEMCRLRLREHFDRCYGENLKFLETEIRNMIKLTEEVENYLEPFLQKNVR